MEIEHFIEFQVQDFFHQLVVNKNAISSLKSKTNKLKKTAKAYFKTSGKAKVFGKQKNK